MRAYDSPKFAAVAAGSVDVCLKFFAKCHLAKTTPRSHHIRYNAASLVSLPKLHPAKSLPFKKRVNIYHPFQVYFIIAVSSFLTGSTKK